MLDILYRSQPQKSRHTLYDLSYNLPYNSPTLALYLSRNSPKKCHEGGHKMPKIAVKTPSATIATIVGSLRLEGLEVEPQVIADMERIDRGELTTEQAIKNAFDRVTREEIQ